MTKSEYEGGWITTFTGKKFHYKKPALREIDIRDIAHHLSLLCRFTGACREFYSVGEHSIRVAHIVPDKLKLSALLHDAAEAYIGDISRPVKYSHKLEETEFTISSLIDIKYKTNSLHPVIKEADSVLLSTEARDLGLAYLNDWAKLPEPLEGIIEPLPSKIVERAFLARFELYKKLQP